MTRITIAATAALLALATACMPNAGRPPAPTPTPACATARTDAGRPPATVPAPACAKGR